MIECPFHSHEVAADWIVMPRFLSSSRKSMVASPSWTSPMAWIFWARKRIRSVTVVLPASMWAMIPMLRWVSRPFLATGGRGDSVLTAVDMARAILAAVRLWAMFWGQRS